MTAKETQMVQEALQYYSFEKPEIFSSHEIDIENHCKNRTPMIQ